MFAGQEALNADVLVELAPVDAMPSPDKSPTPAFRGCGMD
jgi:hypothetical protein